MNTAVSNALNTAKQAIKQNQKELKDLRYFTCSTHQAIMTTLNRDLQSRSLNYLTSIMRKKNLLSESFAVDFGYC
jgi:hypothetical protein